jgi:Domain of unknown function DUF29
MEEILQLREYLESERYSDALLLLDEMEDMATSDKFAKIKSHSMILLLHLIKQAAEGRTTRSWDASINNAVRNIAYTNKRRNAGGFYVTNADMVLTLEEVYTTALERAALEAFGGVFLPEQLQEKFDKQLVVDTATTLILAEQAQRS